MIDANDLGIDILGVSSSSVDVAQLKEIMRDNPLGQSREQTPFGIVRPFQEKQLKKKYSAT